MTDTLGTPFNPAFKGSEFTAEEYAAAWGDDWVHLFMHEMHPPKDSFTEPSSN